MPNQNFTEIPERKAVAAQPESKQAAAPAATPAVIEKTASWPAAGGKGKPKHNLGVTEAKAYPKKEGF